jgi:hypothetical protein
MCRATISLSKEELREVTGYKTATKQRDALIFMDIPFKIRPNGTLLVLRSEFETVGDSTRQSQIEPMLKLI